MFKHLKKPVSKQDNAEATGSSSGSGILLEPLEPRILLSAEIAIPPQDLAQDLLLADSQPGDLQANVELEPAVTSEQFVADTPAVPAEAATDTGSASNTDATDTGRVDQAPPSSDNADPAGEETNSQQANEANDRATDTSSENTPAPETETPTANSDIQITTLPAQALSSFIPPAGLQLVFVDPSVPEFESLLASLPVVETETASLPVADADSLRQDTAAETGTYIDLGAVDIDDIDIEASASGIKESDHASNRVQVFVLDSSRDGLTQMTEVLSRFENVAAVNVVSHGAAGYLRLGNATVNNNNLNNYQSQLREWGNALSENADVLLYGCDVADGQAGLEFITRISELTGADVAASIDDTGGTAAGGDWVLEQSTGTIEAASLFSNANEYNYVLDAPIEVAGTENDDTYVLTATTISDGTTVTPLTAGHEVIVNAGAGDNVITVTELASVTFTLTVNGDGNNTLDLSSLSADLNVSVQQADGSLIISDQTTSLVVSGIKNLIGGSGITTLDYSLWTKAIDINLQAGTATGFSSSISISNIDKIIGGSGDDILIGDAGNNTIIGNAGNDRLEGGAGNDTYVFADGWGKDTLIDTEGSNTPDFDAVTGVLSLSNTDGSIAIGDGVNTVSLKLAASDAIANAVLDISDWQAALEGGMQQLSNWAGALGDYGEMANALPTLGLTLDQVLDAQNSIIQLEQRLENYFIEAQDAGETPTSDGLLTYLAGLDVRNVQDNPELGGLNASIASGMTLDIVIGATGNPELKFNFNYNAERSTEFAIDLGREAAELGVQLDAAARFDLSAQMNLDAALGLSIVDSGENFFLDVNQFDVSATIDANDLSFGADIGFLETRVRNASIQLDAGLDLGFSDISTDNNGANRLSIEELEVDNIGDLLDFSQQAGNGLTVSLPVNVYSDAAQSDAVQNQLWDTFTGQTIGVTAADVFSGEAPDVSLSDDIRDFNNLSAEEMLGMLNQLDAWLLQLAKSEVMDLEIPLTDGVTIGESLDFAQAFRQDVLEKLASYDDQGLIQRDADGNPILYFDSVQTLSEKLTEILGAYTQGIEVLAEYDVDSQDLSFRLDWSRVFSPGSTAVDFNIDLGTFGGVQSASELALAATANLGFSFGVNLAPNEDLFIAPPLFAPELPANGVLSGTATFSVALYEESASGETLLTRLDLIVEPDSGNNSIDDLVEDVQQALDTALENAARENAEIAAGDIVAEYTGNRIALTALPGSTTVDNGDGTSSAQTLDRRVQVDTMTTDPAYRELGLMISPTPLNGVLSGAAEFTLVVDENEYRIRVSENSNNSTVDDLVDDINAALARAVDSEGNSLPAGVEAYRALNSNLIVFKVTADAGVARFSMKDVNTVAADELGFDFGVDDQGNANEPVARGRATEFFIEDARFSGNITLDASAITGGANLGFLGVNIDSSAGSITASVDLDLYDSENDSRRITLDRLLAKMADGDIANATTGIVDAGINGKVDVDLTVSPETGIDLADARVSLDLNIPDWLANPPVMNDSRDANAIAVSYTSDDISEYLKFENIGFADVISGLNQAVDYLRDLEGEGGSGGLVEALDKDLPVINRSTSDLLNMADQFASMVDDLQADPASSVQATETLIKDYLGLAADSDLVELVLDTTAAGAMALRIDLSYTRSQDMNVPMELSLDRLASLAGFDGFNDRFGNFIGVSSTGDLDLEVDGTFNLSMGLDLSEVDADTPPTAFMYGGEDGTGLDFAVRALGSDLAFTAQTGPFGINVIDGEVSLGSGINVFLDNAEYDFGALNVNDLSIGITNGGLAQAADISLPVYFPSISSPVGGEGNNIMAISVGNIADFFDGVAGSVSIDAPDFTDLEPLTLFGMLSNPAILVDGLDALLGTLQDGLNSEVLDVSLPFLGDALQPAAQFIENFREDTLAYISTTLKQSGAEDPDVLVQEALFNIFAAEADGAEKLFGEFGALGLLQDRDNDGIDLDDIEVSGFGLTDTFGQFDFQIGQSYLWEQPIGFDLGLPAIDLDLDAGVELGIEWLMDFGFGIDQTDGFYFVTENANEIEINATATLLDRDADGNPQAASASGTLGFLQVNATDGFDPATDADDDLAYSHLALNFAVELDDPNSDGRLTFGEMVSPVTDFKDIVSATAAGHALGDLNVNVNFGGLDELLDAVPGLSGLGGLLPEIDFDLAMDWTFLDADTAADSNSFGGSPKVAFNNIELDLGSFITDFAGPFLEQIGDVLDPLDWLIGPDGMLNKRLPVISDLSGYTVTLASLAERYDPSARITPFLNSVQQIYNLIDMVSEASADANANGGSLVLNFGDMNLTEMAGGDLRGQSSLAELDAPARSDIDLDSIGSNNGSGKAKEFAKTVSSESTVGEGSVDFAILKPANIFGLLLGKEDVNLITYDLPALAFNFDYRQSFPVFGPLSANLRGGFNAGLDLAMGYDTLGLSRFLKTDNPAELINGFFVSDIDFATGEDVVEAWLRGSISAGASLNLLAAEAGVEGGISTGIDFNLSDLNNDGKVRFTEMGSNLRYNDSNPLAVFDISGTIDWFFRAFVEVDLLLYKYENSMDLGSGTLYDFNVDFLRQPMPAQIVDSDLILNIGKNSEARQNGNLTDGDEVIRVDWRDANQDYLRVTYGEGSRATYWDYLATDNNITRIVVDGGAGNDRITIADDIFIATEIDGGSGDDIITGGGGINIIRGGEGRDTIIGRGANDELYGDEGDDIIEGGDGNDILYGGAGNDILRGFAGEDALYGEQGNDTLEGGVDNDSYYFADDFGKDTVNDTGSELDRAADQAGDVWDFGAVTTKLVFDFGSAGYLDGEAVKVSSLTNTVTEIASQPFAVETVLGGKDADIFNVYQTADYGVDPGRDILLLDGGDGSDTYKNYFKPSWVMTSVPMNVAIRDTGNFWDRDEAISFGTSDADIIDVNETEVRSGDQRFQYGLYGDESGLEALTVKAKAGDDSIFVESTPDYLNVTVEGEDDNDLIVAGRSSANIGGGGLLDNIRGIDEKGATGGLVVRGGDGSDTLIVDDSSDPSDNLDGVLSDEYISGMGMSIGIDYGTVETLGLIMGSGNDIFTVTSSIGGTTYLIGNAGNDVINIQSASGVLEAYGGDGNDSITLQNNNSGSAVSLFGEAGDDILNVQRMIEPVIVRGGDDDDVINVGSAAPDSGGTVNFISDLLDVDGEAGNDILNVDDTAETDDDALRVTSTLLTGLGMSDGIAYANMEFININTGSGSDTVDVESTAAGSLTTISTFAGDATINVSSDAPSNNGNLDGIEGELTLLMGDGINALNISDKGSTVADDDILITENRITGLAPAAINYFTTGRYDRGVNIWFGEGSDTATVISTHSDSVTTIWANDGDDTVTAVDTDNSADDGLLIVLGEGGSDTLDASGWNAPTILLGDDGEINYSNTNILESVASVRFDEGGNDILTGGNANDWLFGGAGNDRIFGGADDDILFGDGGKVSVGNNRIVAETTGLFIGGEDFLDGGANDDWMLGGAENDVFVGNLADDIMIGEYARITVENDKSLSVVRLGQGKLDLIASTLFDLYTPDVLAFGPFSITGIPPLGSAETAYQPIYNTISAPVGSRGQDLTPAKSAEELAFEEALSTNPPAAGNNVDVKPAEPVAEVREVKKEPAQPVVKDKIDCTRIEGGRLGLSELWGQLLESKNIDEVVDTASDIIDVLVTGEEKKLPDQLDCKPVNGDKDDQAALETSALALGSLLGIQAYTKTRQASGQQFNRKALNRLEQESQTRRYSSW